MTNRVCWLALALAGAALCGAAAQAQDNLIGGEKINGYTGVAFDTTAYSYDYLVDGSLAQDDPAGKRFKTLQAAYAAAPAGKPGKPTVIGIKPNVYLLGAEESAPASMTITKNWITLLGLTDDRRKVVIADNRGNKEGATNNGFVLIVNATGFTAMNLTVVNYCNLDYEYPGDASKNLKKRSDVITQAVAVQSQGDMHVYSHVAILGRLDTMFIQTVRSYFTNAYVEGTDDFLGGGQIGVFQDSEIYFPTGNGVMSASGLVFINTVFKASRGLEFYKGVRSPVALIDCTMPANTPASRVAWMVWKAPVRQNLYSLTYHVKDANGKKAVIADSIVGPPAYTLSRELSDEEVKAFNPWNLLRATPSGPVDNWDPANARTKYQIVENEVYRMAVKEVGSSQGGSEPPGAGPFVSPALSPTIRTGGPGVTLQATVAPARTQVMSIDWTASSSLVKFKPAATAASVLIEGQNTTSKAQYVEVRAIAANGFYVTVHILVEPAYVSPPAFVKKPVVGAPVNGKVSVNYALNLAGREDQSVITWYQCADAACSNPRKVAVSRGNTPLRSYILQAGDVGKYIGVGIQPKHNLSDPGLVVTVASTKPIAAADIKSTTVSPDFRNFVETENTSYENGMWTVLGTWTSVTGDLLVNGYGLRVSNPPAAAPGARAANPHAALLYQRDEPTGDMQVKVVMTPEKTAGQGFGIAGDPGDDERNQRADIYIKYDPRTKTGYSLRFWRTIQSAEKCMFQLYKIENGVGTPVNSQQELTGVFKPNTTITLSIVGNKFTAKGSNSIDGETLSLEGTIAPNQFGGAGVYWSGSVPVGNSNVYSLIELTYPVSK
jgi:hypothetical protein